MNKPIFILGCTKSGTTLVRNLFDGYPGLFSIPTEAHFFQNIKQWVDYSFRRTKPQKLSFEEMKNQLYAWIKYRNEHEHLLSDGFTKGLWNLDAFSNKLFSEPVDNFKQLSDLYIKSMYTGIYKDEFPENHEFVEKSVENAEFAFQLKQLYPKARFIHIIRNPYSNLVAIRKYVSNKHRRFPFLRSALTAMKNSFYYLYKNSEWISDYKVIRYEDLLLKSEEIMKEVAGFLNIPFKPILLQPSLFGKTWSGNSTSGRQFKKISSSNVSQWENDIVDLEIHIINDWFDFILEDYGYTKLKAKRSRLILGKKESIKKYIQNRLLWTYIK